MKNEWYYNAYHCIIYESKQCNASMQTLNVTVFQHLPKNTSTATTITNVIIVMLNYLMSNFGKSCCHITSLHIYLVCKLLKEITQWVQNIEREASYGHKQIKLSDRIHGLLGKKQETRHTRQCQLLWLHDFYIRNFIDALLRYFHILLFCNVIAVNEVITDHMLVWAPIGYYENKP